MECRTKFQAREMEIRVDEADAKTKRAMEMFAEVQARKAERIANQQEFQNKGWILRINCKRKLWN